MRASICRVRRSAWSWGNHRPAPHHSARRRSGPLSSRSGCCDWRGERKDGDELAHALTGQRHEHEIRLAGFLSLIDADVATVHRSRGCRTHRDWSYGTGRTRPPAPSATARGIEHACANRPHRVRIANRAERSSIAGDDRIVRIEHIEGRLSAVRVDQHFDAVANVIDALIAEFTRRAYG